MGAFILGVLAGWLAEWVFYTFWVKPNETSADCSHLKAELEAKDRQITSLQQQVAAASKTPAASLSSAGGKQTSAAASSASADTAAKSSATSASTTTAAKAKSADSKSVSNAPAANTTKAPTPKPAPAAKPKAASKPAAKKAPAKKATVAKKAPAARKTTAKADGDDFTKLSGIGPSMSATLKSLGIDTFEKLAATDDDILRDMIQETGARMNNNKEVMDSWNEQATLAAKGDFEALSKMQEDMKK